MWKKSTAHSKEGKFLIVQGRAYPDVVSGEHTTNIVNSHSSDREAFYNEHAVRLSEAELDTIEGAIGAPICYEHNREDVVGSVSHSYFSKDTQGKRCLHIWARIPLDQRGCKIAQDIKGGIIKGFSVGYGLDFTASRTLRQKTFREISLVRDPFFEGCDLHVSVAASSTNTDYHLYVPVEMDQTESSPPQQQQQQLPQSGTGMMPLPNKPAEEALMQGDLLANRIRKMEAEHAENLKKNDAEKAEMKRRLEGFESEAASRRKKYQEENEPRGKEYIEWMEADLGTKLSDRQKQTYMNAFVDPQYQSDSDLLWKQCSRGKEVEASRSREKLTLDAKQKELDAERAEKTRLSDMVSKQSRSFMGINKAFSNDSVEQNPPSSSSVAASASSLDAIMCPVPGRTEITMMRSAGFFAAGDPDSVNASGGAGGGRPYVQELGPLPRVDALYDSAGFAHYPYSARFTNPPFMSWMCNHTDLMDRNCNLAPYVTVDQNPKTNFYQRTPPEDPVVAAPQKMH